MRLSGHGFVARSGGLVSCGVAHYGGWHVQRVPHSRILSNGEVTQSSARMFPCREQPNFLYLAVSYSQRPEREWRTWCSRPAAPVFIESEGFKRSPRRQVETGVCGGTKVCQLEFEYLECHEKAPPPPELEPPPLEIHSLVAFSHRLVNRVSQGARV